MKLDTKEGTANAITHLHLFVKLIKKNQKEKIVRLQLGQNELSNRRKKIESYDKKTCMRIQFILEIIPSTPVTAFLIAEKELNG